MSRRLAVGAGMLAGALVLHAGFTRPQRAATEDAAAAFRRAREERRALAAREGVLARRQAIHRRAAAALSGAAGEPGGLVRAVRKSLVESLQQTDLEGVRLGVRPESGSAGATVHLRAQGTFEDVLWASGHVVRAGSGLVLSRVRLGAAARDLVSLDLEAVGKGPAP